MYLTVKRVSRYSTQEITYQQVGGRRLRPNNVDEIIKKVEF